MHKTVQLLLTGRQYDGGETAVTKTSALAKFYQKNGSLYLLFDEASNENGAVIHSRIKYKAPLLELARTGAVTTHMTFEEGKEHMAEYVTPYGSVRLGILTHSLTQSCQNGRNVIRADYSLTSEGEPVSEHEIEILFSET